MSPLLSLAITLNVANVALFAILAYFYGKTVLSTKAKYPLGLFVFSMLLLFHSAGTAAAYFFMGPYYGAEAVPLMSITGSLELVGALVLLGITL